MNLLVKMLIAASEVDWLEVIAKGVFLIACIALGTWIGS